jgi:predicted RNA-binding protein with PIN domain
VNFLIDGYNLMHASGLARRGLPGGALHQARKRFLDWLADAAEGRGAAIRVVFDAVNTPHHAEESDYRGIRVRFASGRTADDEIEELLAAGVHPSGITVVSNDSRLRESARRRAAAFFSCEQFIDWAIAPRPPLIAPDPPPARPEKPETAPTEAEQAALLAAFSRPPAKRRRR